MKCWIVPVSRGSGGAWRLRGEGRACSIPLGTRSPHIVLLPGKTRTEGLLRDGRTGHGPRPCSPPLAKFQRLEVYLFGAEPRLGAEDRKGCGGKGGVIIPQPGHPPAWSTAAPKGSSPGARWEVLPGVLPHPFPPLPALWVGEALSPGVYGLFFPGRGAEV